MHLGWWAEVPGVGTWHLDGAGLQEVGVENRYSSRKFPEEYYEERTSDDSPMPLPSTHPPRRQKALNPGYMCSMGSSSGWQPEA